MVDKFDISYLFEKSWSSFVKYFGFLIPLVIIFLFIPQYLYSVFTYFNPISDDLIYNLLQGSISFWSFFVNHLLLHILLSLVLVLLSLIATVSIINFFVNKKAKTFGELIKSSFRFYFSVVLVSFLISLFLIPLYALFIIPGVVFSVYWMFSHFFIIDKNEKVFASIGCSFKLIRNNWWSTFGRILLLGLINLSYGFFIGFLILIFEVIGVHVLVYSFVYDLLLLPASLFSLIYLVHLYKGLKSRNESVSLEK